MPDLDQTFSTERSLPEELPSKPWDLFKEWWDEAHAKKVQRNPNAMTLATVNAQGQPQARIVLLKKFDLEAGRIVFYTNRESDKGKALAANPRAAAVIHWDQLDLQVRIEGPVTESPDAESDAYFESRELEKKLGAWGSRQSRPLADRDELITQVASAALELGVQIDDEEAPVARPAHWGGYRLWAERVELWCAGVGRVHDRAVWWRELQESEVDDVRGYIQSGSWAATRLNP
ncbi:MAG: pyridoxamine 5'-phosphate oxidase [Planctomycetota bacterium]